VKDMLTPVWFNDAVVPATTPIALAGMAFALWRGRARRARGAVGGGE
jgi:hypothetical protein